MLARKVAERYTCAKELKPREDITSWAKSRLCDVTEWEKPEFVSIAKEIMGGHEAPKHRKVWEFAATILALEELGLLNSNSLALSVAAGTERILFYLAKHLAGVVATDIYGQGDFSYREADISFLKTQKHFAPYPYPEQNLCAAYSNALNLKFPDDAFDFSFCLSSIEHFGGLKNSRRALSEMARVTKPGGYVLVTTEISINDYITDEVFKFSNISELVKKTGLSLISDFDFTLSDHSLQYLCDMRKDNLNTLPHINLKARCSIFTSGLLILKKTGTYEKNHRPIEQKEKLWQIAAKLKTVDPINLKLSFFARVKRKILNIKWELEEKFI